MSSNISIKRRLEPGPKSCKCLCCYSDLPTPSHHTPLPYDTQCIDRITICFHSQLARLCCRKGGTYPLQTEELERNQSWTTLLTIDLLLGTPGESCINCGHQLRALDSQSKSYRMTVSPRYLQPVHMTIKATLPAVHHMCLALPLRLTLNSSSNNNNNGS